MGHLDLHLSSFRYLISISLSQISQNSDSFVFIVCNGSGAALLNSILSVLWRYLVSYLIIYRQFFPCFLLLGICFDSVPVSQSQKAPRSADSESVELRRAQLWWSIQRREIWTPVSTLHYTANMVKWYKAQNSWKSDSFSRRSFWVPPITPFLFCFLQLCQCIRSVPFFLQYCMCLQNELIL